MCVKVQILKPLGGVGGGDPFNQILVLITNFLSPAQCILPMPGTRALFLEILESENRLKFTSHLGNHYLCHA